MQRMAPWQWWLQSYCAAIFRAIHQMAQQSPTDMQKGADYSWSIIPAAMNKQTIQHPCLAACLVVF
jgi:hypothetical protein